jgi:hypothetical protein
MQCYDVPFHKISNEQANRSFVARITRSKAQPCSRCSYESRLSGRCGISSTRKRRNLLDFSDISISLHLEIHPRRKES